VQILVLVATIQTSYYPLTCESWESFEGRGGEGFLELGAQARVSRS